MFIDWFNIVPCGELLLFNCIFYSGDCYDVHFHFRTVSWLLIPILTFIYIYKMYHQYNKFWTHINIILWMNKPQLKQFPSANRKSVWNKIQIQFHNQVSVFTFFHVYVARSSTKKTVVPFSSKAGIYPKTTHTQTTTTKTRTHAHTHTHTHRERERDSDSTLSASRCKIGYLTCRQILWKLPTKLV